MAKLALDPFCVLSAWEKMGGSAFSSDDVQSDDPSAFPLDLSSWEASMKPLSMPAPPCASYNTSIFCSLFPTQELGLGLLPSCFAPLPLNTLPAALSESAQVVPMCPSTSTGGSDTISFSTTAPVTSLQDLNLPTDSEDFNHAFDDADADFNLQLSDIDAVYSATASPTHTSCLEAAVVPDGLSGSHHRPPSPPATTSATTSSAESQPLPASVALELPAAIEASRQGLARPTPTLPAGYGFVPVSSHPHLPPPAATSSNDVVICKPEPVSLSTGPEWCQQQQLQSASRRTPPLPTTMQAPSSLACTDTTAAPAGNRVAAASAVPVPHAAAPRTQPATATAAAAAAGASTHGSGSVHVRTRAECLERYRQKKARRLTSKKIRYHLRKINADKRPRIKGRFVKKEELEEFLASQRPGGPAAACNESYYDGEDAFHMADSDDE